MALAIAKNEMLERDGKDGRLTRPVKVHPGTSKCTLVCASFRSKLRCSASTLTAAFDALYAAFPGGFVMPCLLPVTTIAEGAAPDERD